MQADGRRIRELREQSGRGLRRFAKVAGISHAYLSRIERGEKHNPQPEVMARIATALGCKIKDIEAKRNKTRRTS